MLAHTTKLALLGGGLMALTVVVARAADRGAARRRGVRRRAASVLRLQAPVVLTIFLVYAWTAFLIADGHRRALVRCMLIGLAALFVTGIVLIAELDAQGAALAALVADVVLAAVILRAVRRVGDGRVGVERAYLARYVLRARGRRRRGGRGRRGGAGGRRRRRRRAPPSPAPRSRSRLVPSELIALLPGR